MKEQDTRAQSSEASPQYLVSPELLKTWIDEGSAKVVEVTTHLRPGEAGFTSVSGRDDYDLAHIPSAQYLDLQSELSDNGSEFRFTRPEVAQFEAAVSKIGIAPQDQVVLYAANHPMWACRVWWLFRLFGHRRVAVLDGGLSAWEAMGFELSTEAPVVPSTDYQASFSPDMLIKGEEIVDRSSASNFCLINALSARQFVGEGPHYGRPGHIEGSINLPYSHFLDDQMKFLGLGALRTLFSDDQLAPDAEIATYCGGGIAASIPIFALALLGKESGVRLYDNSLSEWAQQKSWPMAVG